MWGTGAEIEAAKAVAGLVQGFVGRLAHLPNVVGAFIGLHCKPGESCPRAGI